MPRRRNFKHTFTFLLLIFNLLYLQKGSLSNISISIFLEYLFNVEYKNEKIFKVFYLKNKDGVLYLLIEIIIDVFDDFLKIFLL